MRIIKIFFIFILFTTFLSCKKEENNTGQISVVARVLNIGKVGGVEITVIKKDDNQSIATQITDINGEAVFSEIPVGTYFLTASYDDGADTYSGNTIDFKVEKNKEIRQQIILIKDN